MTKKIAILTPGFVPVPAVKGGAVEQLIEYFIDGNEEYHEYDIDLYTVDAPKLKAKKYKYTNLITFRKSIVLRIFYWIKDKILQKDRTYSYLIERFSKKFKTNYYDLVLIENNMDLYKLIYPKIRNEKVIFHLHNDFDCDDPAKTKEKTNFILKTADKVIVVSNFLKNKLINLQPDKKNKIAVVHNGLISANFKRASIDTINKVKKSLGIKKTDFVFLFIGRITADKGLDKLISALQRLKDISNIKCVIVGDNFFNSNKDDEYISRLKRKSINIKEKLIFTGYVNNDELYKIYSISNCVVIPSQFEEVFGVVALEAMSMGLPVIAANSGGLPEVLSKNCACFINRGQGFVSDLAKAMLKLYKNSMLRKNMGIRGKERSKLFASTENQYFLMLSDKIEL